MKVFKVVVFLLFIQDLALCQSNSQYSFEKGYLSTLEDYYMKSFERLDEEKKKAVLELDSIYFLLKKEVTSNHWLSRKSRNELYRQMSSREKLIMLYLASELQNKKDSLELMTK